MTQEGLGEQSRFLYYALLISRAVSALVNYRETAQLSISDSDALRGTVEHLVEAKRAQLLVVPCAEKRMIPPDLEGVQIYQSVRQAIQRAGLELSPAGLGAVVDEFSRAMEAVLGSVPLSEIGEQSFARTRADDGYPCITLSC